MLGGALREYTQAQVASGLMSLSCPAHDLDLERQPAIEVNI